MARGLEGAELLLAEGARVPLGFEDPVHVEGLWEVVGYEVLEGGVYRWSLDEVIGGHPDFVLGRHTAISGPTHIHVLAKLEVEVVNSLGSHACREVLSSRLVPCLLRRGNHC